MSQDATAVEACGAHPLAALAPPLTRSRVAHILSLRHEDIVSALATDATTDASSVSPTEYALFVDSLLEGYREYIATGGSVILDALASQTSERPANDWAAAHYQRLVSGSARAMTRSVMEALRDDQAAQLSAVDLALACADAATIRFAHAFDRAALKHAAALEQQHHRFYQEVVQLATHNRLRLVETADDLPQPQGPEIPLIRAQDAASVRVAASKHAAILGMPLDRVGDLTLAAGEAAANVLTHAGGGMSRVWSDHHAVFVHVQDRGSGITMADLPKATLSPGWSSEVSLGMGFTLMLEMADVLWLATGPAGTTVCIEKSVLPMPEPSFESVLYSGTV